jgi:hypothetical protein
MLFHQMVYPELVIMAMGWINEMQHPKRALLLLKEATRTRPVLSTTNFPVPLWIVFTEVVIGLLAELDVELVFCVVVL